MNIRIANLDDLGGIVDIYNQAITAGDRTADISTFDVNNRIEWFEQHPPEKYPIVVATVNDTLVGYLTLSEYRPGRKALCRTAEVSFYVHFQHHHQGIGSNLLKYAIDHCPSLQIKTLIAMLVESNQASIKFLERFGFEKWGHMPKIIEFDGRQVGHLYYGLRIEEHGMMPPLGKSARSRT